MCGDGVCALRACIFGRFEQRIQSRIKRLGDDGVGFGERFGQVLACKDEKQNVTRLCEKCEHC